MSERAVRGQTSDFAQYEIELRENSRARRIVGGDCAGFDCIEENRPEKLTQRLGQLQRLDHADAVRTPRQNLGQLRTGPDKRSDRPGVARRLRGVDEDRDFVPFEAREQIDPTADLMQVNLGRRRGT